MLLGRESRTPVDGGPGAVRGPDGGGSATEPNHGPDGSASPGGASATAAYAGPSAHLGHYRAADGSHGAAVSVDLDRPHAAVVVGKRGAGKSHTLAVLAEGLATTDGVVPIVVDPMGAFRTLADEPVEATIREPTIVADALPPRAWCHLIDLAPSSPAGTLVWRAAERRATLGGMRAFVSEADAPNTARRAATNHLGLAAEWGVFARPEPEEANDAGPSEELEDAGGGATAEPASGCASTSVPREPVVLDCAALDRAPASAAVAAVARRLYDARLVGEDGPLPWLLVDEAHAFLDGVAERALRRLYTRGRQPGVSLVAATQRPGALPDVAIAQSDLVVAHRLTDRADREALAAARPSFVEGTLLERLPAETGDAVVVDDATESCHAVRVRDRHTPDGGAAPRVSDR